MAVVSEAPFAAIVMQLPLAEGHGLARRGLTAPRACILACLALGAFAGPAHAADDQTASAIKHDAAAANKYFKDHAHAVSEAVSHDAKALGHTVAQGARTTGHAASDEAKKAGKAAGDAAHNAKAAVVHQ
jgi:hypothetical protein